MPTLGERLKHGWNAFVNNKDPSWRYTDYGASSFYRPDRVRMTMGNERSIVTAIYNRISLDVAAIAIKHVRVDQNGKYLEDIDSELNNALTVETNVDQAPRAFMQDVVMSLIDEGCVAIVPTDTKDDPKDTEAFKVLEMRVGKIVEWYPKHVKLNVYNENKGAKEDIILPKKAVAIIENPFYAVMNEPNSTMKRLIYKLNLMDVMDKNNSSGKLDLIIQLPYVIKSDARRQQAEARRKDIEMQLSGSKYGIAYTDGTERITQLNRAVENNLMAQVESLTKTLYGQLGITEEIMNGSASEEVMLNYYNRTIEPILSAIVDEMKRKFLSKTARTQNQSILFFRDPFKLVPVNSIADIADKFTRNEVLSSNEVRGIIGFKPVDDPRANELRNKNLNAANGQEFSSTLDTDQAGVEGLETEPSAEDDYEAQMAQLDDIDSQIDELERLAEV